MRPWRPRSPRPTPPTLVVNADLPKVESQDLRDLLAAIPDDGVAIVEAPDGTDERARPRRAALFAPLFGPGSAAGSRRGAVAVDLPGLAEDLDTL